MLDVWEGSEHASAIYTTISIRRLPIRNAGCLFTKLAQHIPPYIHCIMH